ncbi:YbhB/YbcL family Raf kinase inhibitor-like protein [Ornatilinea apprima]|nr:YbhB/YbcL family Raf kinase inhibitor-like protein [Ornatilinea apprima]
MKHFHHLIGMLLLVMALAGCAPPEAAPAEMPPSVEEGAALSTPEEGSEMGMKISSPAFEQNAGIPELYTCKGEDISPPLSWAGVPEGTASLVLIMDDPDAPVGTWDHWILFNLPANTSELAEDAQAYPEGTRLGRNSWKRNEYGGPCPPGGASHRYFFKLYALDMMLNLPEGVGKAQIEAAMQNHILAQAELVGIYKP